MTKPYGLISDLHANEWSAFAHNDEKGRNNRLMHIVHEIGRVVAETKKAGGDEVVFAGDLFHTRGSVSPSVFNPIRDALLKGKGYGVSFRGICGNHDLGSKESNELHSSVDMLHRGGIDFVHKSYVMDGKALVPWQPSPALYMDEIRKIADSVTDAERAQIDLIVHIGIDGTLSNMPPHGVTGDVLADLGFKRVFSGHYHAHKDFGRGVYSIGAATHQTWGDVGTKAGFMVVYPDKEVFFASHAPNFIDIDGCEDEQELPLIVDGHYVRARIGEATSAEIQFWREKLVEMGAKGVLINSVPPTVAQKRQGVTKKSITSLSQSITDYCTERFPNDAVKIAAECAAITKEVGL